MGWHITRSVHLCNPLSVRHSVPLHLCLAERAAHLRSTQKGFCGKRGRKEVSNPKAFPESSLAASRAMPT